MYTTWLASSGEKDYAWFKLGRGTTRVTRKTKNDWFVAKAAEISGKGVLVERKSGAVLRDLQHVRRGLILSGDCQ